MRSRRLPVRPGLVVAGVLALTAAGCSSGPTELSAEDQAVVDAADVALVGTDNLQWEPDEASAEAGLVTFAMTCEGGVNHDLVIGEDELAVCRPGETVAGELELDAGTYEFLCSIPGHDRSMRGTLTVS